MTVSWATRVATASSIVKFGPSVDKLDTVIAGSSSQYLAGAMVHHHVELTALTPGSTYFYVCGDAAGSFSLPRSFVIPRSASQAAALKAPLAISIYGDWGYGNNGHAVSTRRALEVIKGRVDFTWHLGDISYADDAFLHDSTGFEYENVYNGWMDWIENISDSSAYMVAVGNHESECHSPACLADKSYRDALRNFTAYNHRWAMPYRSSGGSSNMWYSFNNGLVHFVSLNTETDFPGAAEATHGDSGLLPAGGFGADGEYLRWLEQDLRIANESRGVRPWIIAGGHRPLYEAAIAREIQAAVEELFAKYKVDLYISGHEHSYTRTLPVYNGVVTQNGTSVFVDPPSCMYIVVGGAGCDEMKTNADGQAYSAPWVYLHDEHFGTGVLTVHNETHLDWQYLLSDTLAEKDRFTIVRTRKR